MHICPKCNREMKWYAVVGWLCPVCDRDYEGHI